jgi:mRNA interferase RelE/StbE
MLQLLNLLKPHLANKMFIKPTNKNQFKKKLAERLQEPRVTSSKLKGHPDRYKIKLRSVGYRLVYEVNDDVLIVLVVAVGKREKNAVYQMASKR